jgi:hypothetical protein
MEPIRTAYFVGTMDGEDEPYTVGEWRNEDGTLIRVEPMSKDDAEMMRRLYGKPEAEHDDE